LGGGLEELVVNLVKEVEELASRIPYSIADGSLESALRELSGYLEGAKPVTSAGFTVYKPLYQGLRDEAWMLANLAGALRLRMEQLSNTNISGVDYFRRRLEDFLRRLRASLGYNPDVPLSMLDWKPKRRV